MPPNAPLSTSFGKPHRPTGLIVGLVVTILLLIAALVFAVWAFGQMQDYKNNVNQKITAASAAVTQQTAAAKEKEFVEREKNPLKTYRGPETYGSVSFQYPKTWSAYVDQNNTSLPLNGYFNPDIVPGITSTSTYALRVQVVNQPYAQELKQLDSASKNGKATITAYRAPKVPDTLGSRAVGEVYRGQKDVKVLLPVRDKTLEIWTESDQYVHDLDTYVLASLTYSP